MNPNWDKLKSDVNERIDALRIAWEMPPSRLRDGIRKDLCIPAIALLAEFCECVKITDEEEADA